MVDAGGCPAQDWMEFVSRKEVPCGQIEAWVEILRSFTTEHGRTTTGESFQGLADAMDREQRKTREAQKVLPSYEEATALFQLSALLSVQEHLEKDQPQTPFAFPSSLAELKRT